MSAKTRWKLVKRKIRGIGLRVLRLLFGDKEKNTATVEIGGRPPTNLILLLLVIIAILLLLM